MRGLGALARFLKFDFHHPKSALWNEFIGEVRRRLCRRVDVEKPGSGAFPHPFQVRVERWEDVPSSAKIAQERAWRVFTRAGFVNDDPVTIGYRRQRDPRGWEMPADYPALKVGDPGYHPDFVERPLYESDDPPFLALEAPSLSKEAIPKQWQLLTVEERLDYFRTEEMLEKDVYRASVVVTASPRVAGIFFPELPTRLKKFRVFVGKKPNRPVADAGGFIEIAQIFLIRDKAEPDLATDEMEVRQMVYWSLGNTVVQVATILPDGGTLGGGLLTELFQDALDNLTAETASVEWWSQ